MIHTSINALIGLHLSRFIPNRKLLSMSIIIGMILPDLDLILDFILSLFLNFNFLNEPYISNAIFHSLFMIPFLSLLILIYLEYKNKNNANIVIGLSIGMIIHIILDIITLNSIGIFYPLFDLGSNLNLNDYLNFQIPEIITKILYAFDFFFFRLYTWMIINLIISHKDDNSKIIKKLTIWMKIQLYIFLLFLLLIYFDVNESAFSNFFGLLYTPSFVIALYITYKTRKIIN
tara:strand:+ start:157 stop:852 length:696 start_codon:yes stop_codon:yes gene_type:complete